MTIVCLTVPGVAYGGMLLGYWSDPLNFLDGFLWGEIPGDEAQLYFQKVYILYFVSLVLYTIFIYSKQIQYVSFLGNNVVVKRPASEKRYPIFDLQDYRFDRSGKRNSTLLLNFGYEEIQVQADPYLQTKIDDFISEVRKKPHPPNPRTAATSTKYSPSSVTRSKASPSATTAAGQKISPTQVLKEIDRVESKPSSSNALLILVISVFAFASLGFIRWNIEFIAFLLITIFIHECGHLIAMRFFKYTNLKMLFLPFLGGVAIGQSEDRDAAKIALISLAGPVFGIVSSFVIMGIWIGTQYEPLVRLALFSIVLNGFNLLPFKPLDGGHFLNETLFSRFPKAELLFGIFAILGLGFIAFKLQTLLVLLPAAFVLIGLSRNYNIGKIGRRLSNDDGFQSGELDEPRVRRILDEMARDIPALFASPNKKAISVTASSIWKTATKKHPAILSSVALLAFYIALIIFAIPFSYGFIHGATSAPN